MAQFLSPEWITDLDTLLRAAEPPAGVPDVVIEQRVDDVAYQVLVSAEGCAAAAELGREATVTYRQTRETALAIAREERTAHEAFMLGDLVVEGDPSALVDARAALEWLGDTIAPLRAQTSFD